MKISYLQLPVVNFHTAELYKFNRNYSAILATLQITSYALGV